jgi:ubiquinone/menaquinone biosynthesis C-methylase UbiE
MKTDTSQRPLLKRELLGVSSVLDVDCGTTSPLREIPKNFYTVGADIFKPSLLTLKILKFYDDLVLADGRHLPFKDETFDAVLALEVIEHMNKQEGYNFLIHMTRLAKKKVILSTPSGFKPQDEYANVYAKHLSGWNPEEFKAWGFKVMGFGGLKTLFYDSLCRLSQRVAKSPLHLLINLVIFTFADATHRLANERMPERSRNIFCVKVFSESTNRT